jgi:hypothetical protein
VAKYDGGRLGELEGQLCCEQLIRKAADTVGSK